MSKDLFKPPFRISIVGGSGCGKSHLLSNILINNDYNQIRSKDNIGGYFDIDMIYIFSPTISVDESQ